MLNVVLVSFPTRRSSDLWSARRAYGGSHVSSCACGFIRSDFHARSLLPVDVVLLSPPHSWRNAAGPTRGWSRDGSRSEEHTSELQSHVKLVCSRLLEKRK